MKILKQKFYNFDSIINEMIHAQFSSYTPVNLIDNNFEAMLKEF